MLFLTGILMSHIEQLVSMGINAPFFQGVQSKRFDPEEIREVIQELLTDPNQAQLAQALADAGLAVFPESEDMLVINAWIAVVQKDWDSVLDLMKPILAAIGDRASIESYKVVIHAFEQKMDYSSAYELVEQAMKKYPDDKELQIKNFKLMEWVQKLEKNNVML